MYGSSFCIRTREAALFEQHADRRAGESLAERADDAAGDENVFGHVSCTFLVMNDPCEIADPRATAITSFYRERRVAEASPRRFS